MLISTQASWPRTVQQADGHLKGQGKTLQMAFHDHDSTAGSQLRSSSMRS